MENEDLIALLRDLQTIKQQQQELSLRENALRGEVYATMQRLGIQKESCDYGAVRLQCKAQKDYGESVKMLEQQLKEAKNLAEVMGDYVVTNEKQVLVFTPPPTDK